MLTQTSSDAVMAAALSRSLRGACPTSEGKNARADVDDMVTPVKKRRLTLPSSRTPVCKEFPSEVPDVPNLPEAPGWSAEKSKIMRMGETMDKYHSEVPEWLKRPYPPRSPGWLTAQAAFVCEEENTVPWEPPPHAQMTLRELLEAGSSGRGSDGSYGGVD